MSKKTATPEAKPPITGYTRQVNKFAKLKALISKLEKKRDAISDELKETGAGLYEGTIIDLNIFESSKSYVDVVALAAHLKISQKMIRRFTKKTPFMVAKLQGKQNG